MTSLPPVAGSSVGDSFGPTAISADNKTVVGFGTFGNTLTTTGAQEVTRAVRWSVGSVSGEYLPLAPGMNSADSSDAFAISGNGKVIVGGFDVGNQRDPLTGDISIADRHGFRFQDGAYTDYGPFSQANGISLDASTVVGLKQGKAVKWSGTSNQADVLSIPPNSGEVKFLASEAGSVSRNGNVIVGLFYETVQNQSFPKISGFRYEVSGGKYEAITFNSPSEEVTPFKVSSDGRVVVGSATRDAAPSGTPINERAFKYENATITLLGTLPGHNYSSAMGVSGNGSVIVGVSGVDDSNSYQERAVKFQDGIVVDLGAFGTKPSNNSTALGVSDDGTIIVGAAEDDAGVSRPFIFTNQGGTMVDPNVWMLSVTGVNSVISISANLSTLPLEGAHHRPLMSFNTNGNPNAVWATGDAGFDNSPRGREVLAEMGFSRGVTEDLVVGFSVGRGQNRRDLAPVGRTTVTGNYVLGEIDYRLPYDGILSATGVLGDWQHDTRRGYLIAGGYDYSSGKGDIASRGIRARLDAPKIKLSKNVELIPFASYTWMYTKSDAFNENSGSYPASFDSQSHMSKEGQMGLVAAVSLSNKTRIRLSGQVIRRFDREVTSVSGSWLNGAANFSVNNSAPIRDQGRTGIDVDHLIAKDTTLSLSSFYAGSGSRSSLMTSTSVRFSF